MLKITTQELIIWIVILIVTFVVYNAKQNYQLEQSVLSGDVQIECNINGVYETIDHTKITSFSECSGTTFTNGYSKTCRIVK